MKREQEIRAWMLRSIDGYVSYANGQYTVADNNMARHACDFFHDYDEGGNIPHAYFEIAYDVAKEYEKQRNRR